MRIIIAPDTHEQHAGLAVPDGDVFVHCGDLTYTDDLRAITAFGNWLACLPTNTSSSLRETTICL
jgi:hypothetical protein